MRRACSRWSSATLGKATSTTSQEVCRNILQQLLRRLEWLLMKTASVSCSKGGGR